MHPSNWQKPTKTIQKKHNGVIEPCCNNFSVVTPNYAAVTPNYAAIAVRKYAAITQQIIIGLTWPGKFEKNVAVQTCTLIPEQQELQLSVGLVRNIIPVFFVVCIEISESKFLPRMLWNPEKCWNYVLQLLAQFLFRTKKNAEAEIQKCHNFEITPQHRVVPQTSI